MVDFNSHAKISLAIDAIVITTADKAQENNRKVAEKGLQVLLIQRDEETYKGEWSLIGGFVNTNDTLIECAKRKLREKAGIENIYMEQLYTYGDDINRDNRGRVVTVAYMALAPKEKISLDSSRASKKAEWFWVESSGKDWESDKIKFVSVNDSALVVNELAVDHKDIIADALNRIKNKIMYTEVAFHLVNELFTVKELQTVYELLLGKEMQAFRRVMNDKIVETNNWTDGKAHRPARLFRKK